MNPDELQRTYGIRFGQNLTYRDNVWQTLISSFFQRYINRDDTVLDLGAGYGHFINNISCASKFAIDLNPDAANFCARPVRLLQQDCAAKWQLDDGILDVVFTSNFFEHLPTKAALSLTLNEVFRCLSPGGRLIAMGPNIKYIPGKYWDFWDHFLPLTELSLGEALVTHGFEIIECVPRFLPYTMVGGRKYPRSLLRIYLNTPVIWPMLGRQFLVVAKKPAG